MTPDETRLFTTNGVSGDVTVIDVASQRPIRSVKSRPLPLGRGRAPGPAGFGRRGAMTAGRNGRILSLGCTASLRSGHRASGEPSCRRGAARPAGMEKYFPAPLVVGERDETLPVWPILKQEAGSYEVFAYAFESVDFAPIPGFGGTPPDLLVALGPDGAFRDVKVVSHHEPVFLEGLGSDRSSPS